MTYFLPRQFLGPIENGCMAALLSDAYRGSSSQRSGMKESASLKLLSSREVAN